MKTKETRMTEPDLRIGFSTVDLIAADCCRFVLLFFIVKVIICVVFSV